MQVILYAMLVAVIIVIVSVAISSVIYWSAKRVTLLSGYNKIPILSSNSPNDDLELKPVSDYMELTNSYVKLKTLVR